MKQPLLLYPNPVLRQISTDVDPEYAKTDEFKLLLTSLRETLVWYRGVGLSAIQCGFAERVFVMRTQKGVIQPFVNPQITNVDDETVPMEEGCLSLPGVVETVERYPWIVVSALDIESGERKSYDMVGLEAQCVQHEMDHLDGILRITDGAGPVKRDLIKRKIRKMLREQRRHV